jgi:hypothetical protein
VPDESVITILDVFGLIGGDYMAIGRFSNLDLLRIPNCMGLSKTGRCTWLNCKTCMGKECKFKHSEEECKSLRMQTFQRLASLDDSKQTYIAQKYYNGRKPWNKQ